MYGYSFGQTQQIIFQFNYLDKLCSFSHFWNVLDETQYKDIVFSFASKLVKQLTQTNNVTNNAVCVVSTPCEITAGHCYMQQDGKLNGNWTIGKSLRGKVLKRGVPI